MLRQTQRVWLSMFLVLWLAPHMAFAATENFASKIKAMDQVMASYEPDVAIERLASEFSDFVGSQKSAEAVLTGLRDGKPVFLAESPIEPSMTIRLPTSPMSLANAYMAMSLVKMHLAQFGISRPTASQIKIALNGGGFKQVFSSSTRNIHLKGVLARRATGQNWEAIAKLMGLNIDRLSYGLQASTAMLMKHAAVITNKNPSPFFVDVTESEPVGQPIAFQSNPAPIQSNQVSAQPNQEIQRIGRTRKFGSGIVTAGGGTPESVNTIHVDNGEGIVTAGGAFIPSSTTSTDRGNASGL